MVNTAAVDWSTTGWPVVDGEIGVALERYGTEVEIVLALEGRECHG